MEVLPENVAVAGFHLTWEPFDWGRRRNNVAEKTKTVEQARNGTQETESQIAVEVGMKYRKWQEAALLLKASRIAHEAATEQFRVTSNKYKEQAALIKDLLQAQARSRKLISVPAGTLVLLECARRTSPGDGRRINEKHTRNTFGGIAVDDGLCTRMSRIEQPPQGVQASLIQPQSSVRRPASRFSAVVMPDSQVPLAFSIPGYVISLKQVRGQTAECATSRKAIAVSQGRGARPHSCG